MPTFENEVTQPQETAIHGISDGADAIAVFGQGSAVGIRGDGGSWHGVAGISTSTTGGAGVNGTGNIGVQGIGSTWVGVYGETQAQPGPGSSGVWGDGKDGGDGVKGLANGPGKAGVIGVHLSNRGPGVFGMGAPAGHFVGNVEVTGGLEVNGFSVSDQLQNVADLEQRVNTLSDTVNQLSDTVTQQQNTINFLVSRVGSM
ncbi:hypothetical protein [Streptomyces palmae]|uniref:Uncharacterized protein n=1 Tax=Streptomyces palmae TaxID=1701085 RepID=A0A4Z0H9D1_9ACTN|nr:hypothetical protein [Streptomyces palmae]TGB09170.1 hypothetical protein E4099_14115 [Streptomyces palmae]